MKHRNVLLWIGALGLLLFALGNPSVQRTQEARVMESARESLSHGFAGWMLPHCNGQIRLRKPPLAYWMSAAAFSIGGVNAFAGRLPMAICGWLTVGLVFQITRRIANETAGLLSAGVLMGSFLFFKHARLAETDILITLFITAAVEAMCRAFDAIDAELHSEKKQSNAGRWFLFSGAMIGLAVIAKGPPAAFPVLFLLACAAIEKRSDYLRRWFTSGAPIALIVVGAPWWLYVISQPTFWKIMKEETTDVFEGRDHFHLFLVYVPILIKATAPWLGFGIAALIASVQRWRASVVDRRLLLWIASILVPLCCIGNKQDHYVLPLMPPLAIVTGVWLCRATSELTRERTIARIIFVVTLGAMSLAPFAVPLAGKLLRGEHAPGDWMAGAIVLIGVVVCWWTFAKFDLRRAVFAFAAVCAVCIAPLLGIWAPSLREFSARNIASRIHKEVGDKGAHYAFYGDNFSLPLVFEMRRVIPIAMNAAALSEMKSTSAASLVVIAQTKADREPPPMPEGFVRLDEFPNDDQKFEIFSANQK